jgi:hypothetical protein
MSNSLVSSINANPVDQNLLQSSTFQVSFSRLPYIQFFCQEVNIPGIMTNPAKQDTPFVTAPLPADHMTYEYFSMTFVVDEALWSWTSVQDWLKGIAIPESFQQYKDLSIQQRLQMRTKQPQYSDAILTVFSNKNNPILSVQFTDMFPINLSGIQFSTRVDAATIITARATFGFTNYDINRQV